MPVGASQEAQVHGHSQSHMQPRSSITAPDPSAIYHDSPAFGYPQAQNQQEWMLNHASTMLDQADSKWYDPYAGQSFPNPYGTSYSIDASTYGRPFHHSPKQCPSCLNMMDSGQHMVRDCDQYLLDVAPTHTVQKDPRYSLQLDSFKHTFQDCPSHPTTWEVDEHEHRLAECQRYPLLNSQSAQTALDYPTARYRDNETPCFPPSLVPESISIAKASFVENKKASHPIGVRDSPFWHTCQVEPLASSHEMEQYYDIGPRDSDVSAPLVHEKADMIPEEHTAQGSGSQNSGHTSSNGLLHYKRTAEWIRDFLKHPVSYKSRLTELPSKITRSRGQSSDQRRPSEPIPTSLSQQTTRVSTQSVKSDGKFNSRVFKRAVSDLENLLNEALALASQVVDCKSIKSSDSGGYASARDESPGNTHSLETQILHRGSRSSDNYENVDELLNVSLTDENLRPKRPVCQHAATFSGHPERPRLTDLVNMYSGKYHDTDSQDVEVQIRRRSGPAQSPRQVILIPSRTSSKNKTGFVETASYKHSIKPDVFGCVQYEKLVPHEEILTCSTAEVVDFGLGRYFQRGVGEAARGTVGNQSTLTHRAGREALGPDGVAHPKHEHGIDLKRRSHVSLKGAQGFSLAKSYKRQPIARDWSPGRKRFVAAVACISTALVGIILGIYSGLVPSIQYYIIDESYATIHGNTGCFVGLALPTFFLWPLPLLHGRKPYILFGLVLAMPLLFLQAVAVNTQRLTEIYAWRTMLLLSRALMGTSLGFASMNFHSVLMDLFGASLMSRNPHQEVADDFDTRRHGGGMGVWLGIWTWCWIGSLGLGFLIGASIIDQHPPVWGFYVSIMLIAVVLVLNITCPEVRRSPYRRSVAELKTDTNVSRRLARGEVMMHRVQTGPKWWGQEVYHGILLSLEMLRQPGFSVVAVYSGWIYANVVLIIILLGSLVSRYYRLRSPDVGLHVAGITLGALLAIPFQKANLFSRSRQKQLDTNRATLEGKRTWSTHLGRRAVFTTLLPLAGICYAAVSSGPPISIVFPTLFAISVGFLSCLAISECNGLIMETFDTSDLTPGMTGRQRGASDKDQKRTNFSSFPRVTAGFAIIHGFAFILAAGSTALGGLARRKLGQQLATGIVAGILLFLTALLLLVLIRFKEVQIIPNSKSGEMDKIIEARRKSSARRASMPDNAQARVEEEHAWRPVLIGNPVGKNRRMNLLEFGSITRWQEIRKQNDLIDKGVHLNRVALDQGLEALDDHMAEFRKDAHELLRKASSLRRSVRRSHRSDQSSSSGQDTEIEIVGPASGGHAHAASSTPQGFVERDCFMGQSVMEETEDERRQSVGGEKRPANTNGNPRT